MWDYVDVQWVEDIYVGITFSVDADDPTAK